MDISQDVPMKKKKGNGEDDPAWNGDDNSKNVKGKKKERKKGNSEDDPACNGEYYSMNVKRKEVPKKGNGEGDSSSCTDSCSDSEQESMNTKKGKKKNNNTKKEKKRRSKSRINTMNTMSANVTSWCNIDECVGSKSFTFWKDDETETRTDITFLKSEYQTILSKIALYFEFGHPKKEKFTYPLLQEDGDEKLVTVSYHKNRAIMVERLKNFHIRAIPNSDPEIEKVTEENEEREYIRRLLQASVSVSRTLHGNGFSRGC